MTITAGAYQEWKQRGLGFVARLPSHSNSLRPSSGKIQCQFCANKVPIETAKRCFSVLLGASQFKTRKSPQSLI